MQINADRELRATEAKAEGQEKGSRAAGQPAEAVGSCLHPCLLHRPVLMVGLFELYFRKVTVAMVWT